MKTLLLFLLLPLLAVGQPLQRNSATTNATPTVNASNLVNGPIPTGVLTAGPTNGAGHLLVVNNGVRYTTYDGSALTNLYGAPRSHTWDFLRYSNTIAGMPLFAADGSMLYCISSTNVSFVTNGALTAHTELSQPSAAYWLFTNDGCNSRITLTYSVAQRVGGTAQGAIAFLLSTNSLGGLGSTLNLTYGLHIVVTSSGIGIGKISNGSVAGGNDLGLISFDANGTPPFLSFDGLRHTITLNIDAANNTLVVDCDNARGSLSNTWIGQVQPADGRTSYVGWEFSNSTGSTNLTSLYSFHNLSVMNRAASDLYAARQSTDGYARLDRTQAFQAAQSYLSPLLSYAGFYLYDQSSTPTASHYSLFTRNNGIVTINEEGTSFLEWQGVAGTYYFEPAAAFDGLIDFGRSGHSLKSVYINGSGDVATNLAARASWAATTAGTNAIPIQSGAGNNNIFTNAELITPWFGAQSNFFVVVSNGSATGPGTWNLLKSTNGVAGAAAITVNGTNGNVGIGTANPTSPFHLIGAANFTFQSAAAGLSFSGVSTPTITGTYSGAARNTIAFDDGSGNLMKFSALEGFDFVGNVGIGTTTPQTPLHVVGSVTVTNGMTIYKSNNVTAASVAAAITNGDWVDVVISNSLQTAWMSNNVMFWKVRAP